MIEQKHRNVWAHSLVRDDEAKKHPCLVQHASLRDEDKKKGRDAVRRYPDIIEPADHKIVETGSPVRADTR